MANQTHPYGYWTDDRIIEESKKYKTPIEFNPNRSLEKTSCHFLMTDLG